MTGRSAVIGVWMLSALLISALAAQTAVAIPTGTTAFTCKSVASGAQFSDAHCKTGVGGGAGYAHTEIAENTTTEIGGNNQTTPGEKFVVMKFAATIAGAPFEIQATGVGVSGKITNMVDSATNEHTANGAAVFNLGGVTVTKPVDPNCRVKTDKLPGKEVGAEGEIDSRLLRTTTASQGDALKFEPNEGTVLASFWVDGCGNALLNKTYDLTGSFKSTSIISGATVNFNHGEVTTQNTLKLGGQKAGIDGTITLTGEDPEIVGDSSRPLSFTTIATP
jgi:hypothetical protein